MLDLEIDRGEIDPLLKPQLLALVGRDRDLEHRAAVDDLDNAGADLAVIDPDLKPGMQLGDDVGES